MKKSFAILVISVLTIISCAKNQAASDMLDTTSKTGLTRWTECRLKGLVDGPVYTLAFNSSRNPFIIKEGSGKGTYKASKIGDDGPTATYKFTDDVGTFLFIKSVDEDHQLRKVTDKTNSILISAMICEDLQ